jgi:transposase-like protein
MKLREQDYSPEERDRIVEHICEQVANKRPLYKVLAEDEGLCSQATFTRWQRDFPEEVKAKVVHARELAFEAHIEDMISIADGTDDSPSLDPQVRKVRIYAREKAAAMIAPRRFGAKVDVTSGGEALPPPAPLVAVQDNRVQTLIHIAAQRMALGLDAAAERARLLDD